MIVQWSINSRWYLGARHNIGLSGDCVVWRSWRLRTLAQTPAALPLVVGWHDEIDQQAGKDRKKRREIKSRITFGKRSSWVVAYCCVFSHIGNYRRTQKQSNLAFYQLRLLPTDQAYSQARMRRMVGRESPITWTQDILGIRQNAAALLDWTEPGWGGDEGGTGGRWERGAKQRGRGERKKNGQGGRGKQLEFELARGQKTHEYP